MIFNIVFLVIAFLNSAVLGKYTIPLLKKLKVGQNERYDGPRTHLRKQGTPTMGGIIFIISFVVVTLIYLFVFLKDMDKVLPILGLMITGVGFGLIGFIDDYKKVVKKNTEGLNPKLKMVGLFIISVLFSLFLIKYLGIGTGIFIPFIKYELVLPVWLYIAFIILVMLATTNAVNLTDGVDGLAGSVSTIIMVFVSIIGYKLNNPEITTYSLILAGSISGFLIYNFHKAKVIMGDTGSLFIGGVLASIMIYLKLPLLLLILAIVPVIETLSVILQVVYFSLSHGKRLLKMAPLHHHFELIGWRENRVVAVFSAVTVIAGVLTLLLI